MIRRWFTSLMLFTSQIANAQTCPDMIGTWTGSCHIVEKRGSSVSESNRDLTLDIAQEGCQTLTFTSSAETEKTPLIDGMIIHSDDWYSPSQVHTRRESWKWTWDGKLEHIFSEVYMNSLPETQNFIATYSLADGDVTLLISKNSAIQTIGKEFLIEETCCRLLKR